MRASRCLMLLASLSLWLTPLSSSNTYAQPLDPSAVPAELKDWVAWVRDRNPQRECVQAPDGMRCVWPSELTLNLGPSGGTFRMRTHVDAQQTVALPGEPRRWPKDVRVDGRPAIVIDAGGHPAIELQRGAHAIDGAFGWNVLPETLSVPPATALIALTIDGRALTHPRRDEAGQLWLSGGASAEREGEHLELEVVRHVQDGVPLIITSEITIKASGRAREISLDHVLVPGTTAFALSADLPARIEKDGRLSVQARAGTFCVTLTARSEGSPDRLTPPNAPAPWPVHEIWVFQADESLRQTKLGGAPGIDPAQTNIKPEWQQLPAFVLRKDTALTFETTRRGQPEPPPNQLTLNREMWLDLDGTGYTVRDHLSGELHSGWRLSLPAGQLGHVQGNDGDQLITEMNKQTGVELRSSNVALTAEWRTESAQSDLPAVGWSEDMQSLSAQLHLPPGWSIFTAQGVDHVSNTWLQGWDLFRFFFALIVALAAGRMFGLGAGVVALFTLVLCHQQDDAPEAVWLVLLAVLGLLRVIPEGHWRTLMRVVLALTLIAFAVVATPFAIDQIRSALYPQLDAPGYHYDEAASMLMGDNIGQNFGTPAREAMEEQAVPSAAPAPEAPMDMDGAGVRGGGGDMARKAEMDLLGSVGSSNNALADVLSNGYDASSPRKLIDRDPNAVVQTGPGVPSRAFRSWQLTWTGPVEQNARIQLWLIPPLGNSVLAFLRVLLIGLLAFLLVRRAPFKAEPSVPSPPASTKTSSSIAAATTSATLACLLALLMPTTAARADTPSAEVLSELEARLFPQPTCLPSCISITQLDLQAQGNELVITIEAHAGANVAYRLPGPVQAWTPRSVSVDGREDAALALADGGHLHLRLSAGTHRVQLRGPLSSADSITLSLGDTPRRVSASMSGWEVSGLHEDGSAEDSIQLSRSLAPDPNSEQQAQSSTLPPWLQVTRQLELGVTWHVITRVQRISPVGSPVLVRVPLLPGESVTAADVQVEAGQALVTLGRDATEAVWSSTLAQTPLLTLTAPSGQPWSEQWVVQCGRVFHCTLEGTAPIRHTTEGQWWPAYRPWPGESLTLKTTRPPGAKGQSTTLDSVTLTASPGVRMRRTHMTLSMRSSTGGVRTMQLPKAAKIQSLTIDGQRTPIRFHDGQLSYGIARGAHEVAVEWQEPMAMQVADATPSVNVGGPATNVHLNFNVPGERWLLWVSGPTWGPAILFWGYLLAMLAVSLVLARIPHSPLRAYQWMLLTIGLTQVHTLAQLVIAGWFFALAYRAHKPLPGAFFHNIGQLALVGWTFVALGCLYWALHSGLLFPPDMQIANASIGGDEQLSWYVDRVSGQLPSAHVVSVSIWVWRGLMLAWALWLASSLLRWLPWAWRSFVQGGGWKPMGRPPAPMAMPPAVAPTATPLVAPPVAAPPTPSTTPPTDAT